jgi:mono/diheme cytochrome c family protein
MSRHQYFLFSLVVIGFSVFNCSHRGPADDKSDQVLRGETIFNRQCASCHSIDKDAIGPALGGITQILKEEWIRRFIKDPGGVIAAGDEHASKMFERYKVVMPPFPSLREDEVSGEKMK